MPKAGETLTGNGFFTAHGGKGANQAVAAARLGGKVIMCGCVGDDAFGKEALASLQTDDVDVSHIRVIENTPTGTAFLICTPKVRQTFGVHIKNAGYSLYKKSVVHITLRKKTHKFSIATAWQIPGILSPCPLDTVESSAPVAQKRTRFNSRFFILSIIYE